MVPTSLSVRNFMCYRAGVDLDLRGVRIACLSGDNGAGKSALLDCITWALWGKARVNSDRDLMALNATEMEVTFGFELNNQEFRVTRRRTRGGAGPLTLDIQTLDGDRWRTTSGATARETQRAIDKLLKMDYDTFINSAFILQGRADEFTTKTPALRKQTLAEILNLSDYDRYEEIARQRLRDCERMLREIDADILRIDARLSELPARRAEVERLSHELVQVAELVDGASDRLSAMTHRLHLLELSASQRDQIRSEIQALEGELVALRTERKRTAQRIDEHLTILARREQVEARHRELSDLRREQEQIGVILATRQSLLQERRVIEVEIQRATHLVESEMRSTRDGIMKEQQTAASRTALEATRETLRVEIESLAARSRDLDELRRERSLLETRRGELRAENERLRADMDDLKGRLVQIEEATAVCPVCRRELGPEERARIGQEYHVEGKALGDKYRDNRAELKQIETDLRANEQRINEIEQLRLRVDALARQEALVAERITACDRAAMEIVRLRTREQELAAMLAGDTIAPAERTAVAEIDAKLRAVPFDEARHGAIQSRITELLPVEQEINALLTAGAAIESDRQHLKMIDESIAQRSESLEEKTVHERELSRQVEGLEHARAEQDFLAAEVHRLERVRGEQQEQFGAAQQRVRDLENLEDERTAKETERRTTADDVTTFDELALAFGKRGIQAMIIENVVPELQDEANRILDKMPGNTMRVEFRTQRQTLRGEGTIETLDIVISDEIGSRTYELYSGGEAFRANFAIRVALSMLLAKRAGARLQTLVIDEGFGTQDSRGRDGLIEAIRAVEPEFRMILVITHIAELKDVFPTRIEVVKGIDGSLVTIN